MSKQLTALIIDDESTALESLETILVEFCPQIRVLDTFNNAVKGLEMIEELAPDVVFLDVEMPILNGFDLVKRSEHQYKVVLCTAYNHFAREAFQIKASNYLLKPIGVADVVEVVQKLCNETRRTEKLLVAESRKVGISGKGVTQFIKRGEIQFLKADGGYVEVHLHDQKILSTLSLTQLSDSLGERFLRIHHSFTVSLDHIVRYDSSKSQVTVSNGERLPLSRRKKDQLLAALKNQL